VPVSETAAKLFGRIRNGGRFGYAFVFPTDVAATNPTVELTARNPALLPAPAVGAAISPRVCYGTT
jgi:hypothetical protein